MPCKLQVDINKADTLLRASCKHHLRTSALDSAGDKTVLRFLMTNWSPGDRDTIEMWVKQDEDVSHLVLRNVTESTGPVIETPGPVLQTASYRISPAEGFPIMLDPRRRFGVARLCVSTRNICSSKGILWCIGKERLALMTNLMVERSRSEIFEVLVLVAFLLPDLLLIVLDCIFPSNEEIRSCVSALPAVRLC
jgi:hypothetical protein